MRMLKMLCCATALAAMIAPAAHADEWNKLTYFTFSGPVQIPNATLPAGTYAFKLADLNGNRHVVQIFNKDQTKIYATILAIADDLGADHYAEKPIVMFSETPAGQPAAVKAWFYPGNRVGDEFVYPKDQAVKIAKAYHKPVLAADVNTNGENNKEAWKSADIGHVDENGQMTKGTDTTASNRTVEPAAPTATTAKNDRAAADNDIDNNRANAQMNRTNNSGRHAAVGTSGQTASNDTNAANANNGRRARHLPRTASPLEAIALLSGLMLAGGLGVRRARTRLAENA